ncbi:MAG TPA: NUDIX hydrolase [Gaiellales bacterium]|nr:NUDIX hydrolase [Gaiellales bacterium]
MTGHAGWRHCPVCRAALLVGTVAGDDRERLHCPDCGLVLYDNPAPTASAVVVRGDGRIMLVRRGIEPARGLWDLPGGFVEAGEHPEQAARRELLEETGVEVELTGLLGIWCDRYGPGGHTINVHYGARPVGGRERVGSDVAEIAWFPPDQLPEPELIAFPNCSQALAEHLLRSSVKRS